MISKRASNSVRYLNLFRRIRNPADYLWWKLGIHRPDPISFVFRSGVTVQVPARRLGEFKEIVFDDAYLRGFRRGFLGPGSTDCPVIVDVGANLGFFTLYVGNVNPRAKVVAVEPLPGNFGYLLRNIQRNPQIAGSVISVTAAVSGYTGIARLRSAGGGDFPTDAKIDREGPDDGPSFVVRCLTLGDLLRETHADRVTLLKMDCEGAEFEIVYRAERDALDRVGAIAMEVHEGDGNDQNMKAMVAFLIAAGYSVCQSRDGGFLWAARDPRDLAYWRPH